METAITAETELKLSIDRADLGKLKPALLAMAAKPHGETAELESTYYDTHDLALQRNEVTLRVRRKGRQLVQTVKAENGSGLPFERGEWEDSLAGRSPDLSAPTTGSKLPQGLTVTDLQPLFTTKVSRFTVDIEQRPDTLIEAAIDEGEIEAGGTGRIEPICEIELELKKGEPAALYDIALRLLDVAPVRLSVRAKSERGYRLADLLNQRPRAVHADPLSLRPEMTVDHVIQQIGRHSLLHLMRNEEVALLGLPEGIHQMRVALRRLRSALSALKPMLPPDHFRWASDEMKWLGSALGAARNWDVFIESLLAPVLAALPTDEDLKSLAEAAQSRRKTAYDAAHEAILSEKWTGSLLRLLRWFEVKGWRDQPVTEQSAQLVAPIGDLAGSLLEDRHRSVRKRSRHFKHAQAPQRHRLRIAVKKLRYTIEFLENLFDAQAIKALDKDMKPLQDALGNFNDVRVAHDLVLELRGSGQEGRAIDRAGGLVLGWHEHALARTEKDLRKNVKRLVETKAFWSSDATEA